MCNVVITDGNYHNNHVYENVLVQNSPTFRVIEFALINAESFSRVYIPHTDKILERK